MVKIRFGINTSFVLRRWTQPKQWLKLIHSKLGLEICELSLDLLDPMLREPTKTEYMQEILELGDQFPVEVISCRTCESQYKDDMLLHPNFGHRMNSVQWYEKAIDIAAYTNASYVGGYFGGLVIQEHVNPKLLDYVISFIIDSMSYLTSIAYTAGLQGLFFEPFSLVPDVDQNISLNQKILVTLIEQSQIAIKLSPIAKTHDLSLWIPKFPKDIQMVQIHSIEAARTVKTLLQKSDLDTKETVNIILNVHPAFNLSPKDALDQVKKTVDEIKKALC
ncbi:MAG: hypothetical protein EU530_06305 [Promethearchaeota archaeon]|nr:MAG: hypothetical protein EU530_06305 [Candidatus Lokiarchaeota archaeon]